MVTLNSRRYSVELTSNHIYLQIAQLLQLTVTKFAQTHQM